LYINYLSIPCLETCLACPWAITQGARTRTSEEAHTPRLNPADSRLSSGTANLPLPLTYGAFHSPRESPRERACRAMVIAYDAPTGCRASPGASRPASPRARRLVPLAPTSHPEGQQRTSNGSAVNQKREATWPTIMMPRTAPKMATKPMLPTKLAYSLTFL